MTHHASSATSAPPTPHQPLSPVHFKINFHNPQLVLRFLHFFREREGLSSAEVEAALEERRVLSLMDGTSATHSAQMCNGGSTALVPSVTYF